MFRKIPVDAARLQLFVGSPVRPVAEYAESNGQRTRTDNQARNEAGQLMWTVELGSFTAEGLVVIRVKFPSQSEPSLTLQQPVRVEALECTVVNNNQYFAAANVSAVKQG